MQQGRGKPPSLSTGRRNQRWRRQFPVKAPKVLVVVEWIGRLFEDRNAWRGEAARDARFVFHLAGGA